MTPHRRSHPTGSHRRARNSCRCDEDGDLSRASSANSPTAQSVGSQDSQLRYRTSKGLDIIENLFSTIFGGCCRPGECAGKTEAQERNRRKQQSNCCDSFKVETPQRRLGNFMENGSIPQPPEIRRLALDDELGTPDVDRSGSLSFLFYQQPSAD